ncbi:AP endonuclease [Clostridium estertheticum]|uniref:DUF6673 family protein n=1 Tax=Clostridium estertheticum TaxID=238834 RepID=UPI001CF2E786|nr:DUF6673 family protein [Clostridium estertheticum]MCB2308823.1 AP endonuclease [Clostridium estertheticum]MCB2347311.1 AP endonuclease [Clostridium estertheticum]MCB2351923.1 AP endonuclease [Clostridium estertheticum]WAG48510.1 AP endonuclease [Clostridium estertheticum]
MIINNVELEDIDILDADIAEKYEDALSVVDNISEKVKDMGISQSIRTQCTAIFDVFNTLFGEGTDKKVFGDKSNLLICLKAFEELVIVTNSQREDVVKFANKYSPNRASRRTKK